jgi:hypothetical protein
LESSLFAWRRRLGEAGQAGPRPRRRAKQAKPAAAEAFVEVKAKEDSASATAQFAQLKPFKARVPEPQKTAAATNGSIELHLCPGGQRRLVLHRGFDPQTLATALAVLENLENRS